MIELFYVTKEKNGYTIDNKSATETSSRTFQDWINGVETNSGKCTLEAVQECMPIFRVDFRDSDHKFWYALREKVVPLYKNTVVSSRLPNCCIETALLFRDSRDPEEASLQNKRIYCMFCRMSMRLVCKVWMEG